MAHAPEVSVPSEQVVFEPDEVSFAEDRVTVTGRWFGVRGRRFVRPTLRPGRDGEGSRVLADLEHKPWPAADGELWTAAFTIPPAGGGAEELELAVAPDIAVVIPAPEELRARPTASPRRRSRTAVAAERPDGRDPEGEQRAEITRLRDRLTKAEIARAELNAAISKRDAAVAKLEAVLRERDAAVGERDAAVAEREAVVAERDELRREREALREEREALLEDREALLEEREALLGDRALLQAERDVLERRGGKLERTTAELVRTTQELQRAQTELTREGDGLRAERDRLRAALANAASPSPVPIPAPHSPERTRPLPPIPRRRAAASEERSIAGIWATRTIALVVLAAAIAALLLVIQSV